VDSDRTDLPIRRKTGRRGIAGGSAIAAKFRVAAAAAAVTPREPQSRESEQVWLVLFIGHVMLFLLSRSWSPTKSLYLRQRIV